MGYYGTLTTGYQPPAVLAGLDIGRQHDPTALALLWREMTLLGSQLEPRYLVRYLERVPLGTAYPQMVRDVRETLDLLPSAYDLIVDATGVGLAIVDLFKDMPEALRQRLSQSPTWPVPASYRPIALTLVPGRQTTGVSATEWHVPKRDVVFKLQVAVQQGRVQVAQGLPLAPMFDKEITNFELRFSAKREEDQYGAWREGEYDDLLLAVAIAVWWGERTAPRQLLQSQQTHARHPGNPLLTRR